MPRRARIQRRVITPDPVYTHGGVAKFINCLMLRGKKSTAERIVYDSFDIIKQRNRGADPLETFENALRNATPILEVKPKRVGGATYQVPVEIRPDRRAPLARRWIIRYPRTRTGKSMAEKLANQLMAGSHNRGPADERTA